jgi:transcriptional regulator with XRE-family HTH domain
MVICRYVIGSTNRKERYMTQGSLGERLRVLRAQHGLSLTEASEKIGVNRHTLRDLELDKREPYGPTIRKIAEGYGVPVARLLEEPVLAGKAEAPDTGQPGAEQTARDIAHAEALRQEAEDRKAARRTLASEGIDHARRISDVYDPATYDALRRQPPEELAGALLDSERGRVHEQQERALLEEKVDLLQQEKQQEKEAKLRLREENARLRQDLAEYRAEAEREGARR